MNINLLRLYTVWGRAFSWITNNSKSLHLFYNNIETSYRLLERCYSIKFSSTLKEDEIMMLGLASLFQNFNHTGSDNYTINCKNACDGFAEFINQTLLEIDGECVIEIIKSSYDNFNIESPPNIIKSVFCDCVFLSKYDEDWISHVFYGYRLEKKYGMKDLIDNEFKLILNPPISTEWAKSEFNKIRSGLLVDLDMFKKIIV